MMLKPVELYLHPLRATYIYEPIDCKTYHPRTQALCLEIENSSKSRILSTNESPLNQHPRNTGEVVIPHSIKSVQPLLFTIHELLAETLAPPMVNAHHNFFEVWTVAFANIVT